MIHYIDGPEVKITENDGIFVDVEFFGSDDKWTNLEVHRLFPKSGGDKYLVLLDEEGEQKAVIRDAANLMDESRKVVLSALDEYYLIPKIRRFISMTEKFKVWMWTAETDHGIIKFEIRNHIASVKPLYDGRVLIKDANDNRYEIEDYRKLDKRSRVLLEPKL